MKTKMMLDYRLLLSYTWNDGRKTWLCLCASACSLCAETFSACLVTSHGWGGRKQMDASWERQRGEVCTGEKDREKRHNVGKKEQGQEMHKRNEEKHREDIE